MDCYKELINQICVENEYLLTFQVQPETKHLVKCLIALRDGKTTDLKDLSNALEAELELLDKQKNALDPSEPHYESHLDYLDEIREGIASSYARVLNYT